MTQSATAESSLTELAASWRVQAEEARRWAADGAARALEQCADQLTARLHEQDGRLLSIKEAAALTGRHRDTIGYALSKGTLPNYGVKNRPRIRYADVVRQFPPRDIACTAIEQYDSLPDARAFLGNRRGAL